MAGWFELFSSIGALGIGIYAILSNYLGNLGEDYRRALDGLQKAADRLSDLGDDRDSWNEQLSAGESAYVGPRYFQFPKVRGLSEDEHAMLPWTLEWVGYNAHWPSTVRVGRHLPLLSRIRQVRKRLRDSASNLDELSEAEEREEIEAETAWLVFLESAEDALGSLWRAKLVQHSITAAIVLILYGSLTAIATVIITWGAT